MIHRNEANNSHQRLDDMQDGTTSAVSSNHHRQDSGGGVVGTPSVMNSMAIPSVGSSDKGGGGAGGADVSSDSPKTVKPEPPVNPVLRYGSLILLVAQNCSAVLLMRYVQAPGRDSFCIPCANIFVEIIKFLICALVIIYGAVDRSTAVGSGIGSVGLIPGITAGLREVSDCIFKDFKESSKMAVPAGLFTIQNNLLFVALANLDATLFQVSYQLKLLATALLMVLMLGRDITRSKWLSLVLLFAGIVLTQIKPSPKKADDNSSMVIGMSAVVTCAFMSAFASVYFEKVLKSQGSVSLAVRNVQLAVFSTIFNLVALQLQSWYNSSSNGGGGGGTATKESRSTSFADDGFVDKILAGFDGLVWAVVLVQAAGGLLVAAVIKYADNILKGFATAVAIVVNGLVSYVWLEFVPTQLFLIGATIVISATMMYSILP